LTLQTPKILIFLLFDALFIFVPNGRFALVDPLLNQVIYISFRQLKPPQDADMKFQQMVDVYNHFVILANHNFSAFPKSWMLKKGMPQTLKNAIIAVIGGIPKGVQTLINGPKNEKKKLIRKVRKEKNLKQ
jgi:hypothetical protein